LNDLTLSEISAICGDNDEHAVEPTRVAMSRLRVDQYFNPPTDELILTALAGQRQLKLAIALPQKSELPEVISVSVTEGTDSSRRGGRCGGRGQAPLI